MMMGGLLNLHVFVCIFRGVLSDIHVDISRLLSPLTFVGS
jgi:hypothetical protein